MRDVARRPAMAAIALALVLASLGAARPSAAQAHEIPGMDRFLYALGQVESGGQYDAYNSSSGAYGKYQIIPSSWAMWAERVLGDADAPMTAANQELVARATIHDAFHRYEQWRLVAYWWLTGRVVYDSSQWTSYARSYVDKVMTIYTSATFIPLSASSLTFSRYQETSGYIGWSGHWRDTRNTSYAGDQARWSDEKGATATFRFRGYSVTWIGPRGANRGKARVYIDGVYVAMVDQYASSFQARSELFTRRWTTSGYHRLTIKVVGTTGRPVVIIDEFRVGK